MTSRSASSRAADPAAAADALGKEIVADDSATATNGQANPILKAHFDRAVELLEQKAELATDVAEWRRQARGDGLVPKVIIKLAREHLQDSERRRRAAEEAEVEELYRQGLDLPLFGWRAAE
jgi:uncharacterized protein (UPF0335 family)